MTSRRPLRGLAAVALAAAAVTLSGCSGGSPAVVTSVDPMDSPLARYLSPLFQGVGSDEQLRADHDSIQRAIAACMTAEGFDYTPLAYDPLGDTSFPGDWRPDDRSWVVDWGYGVLDFPAFDEVVADNADGDENTAYYESLGSAEQAAYSDTLWGPLIPLDPDGAGPTWQQTGCNGSARHEVYGDDPRVLPENEVVMAAVRAFSAAQFTAPAYDELDAAWAECMADAGYPGFTRQGDAKQSIFDAVDAYRFAGSGEDDRSDPAYQELKIQEIELALADLGCREQTDYSARSLAIQYEQEEQFIADHRSELDAMIAQAHDGDDG